MRNKFIFTIWLVGMLVISFMGLLLSTSVMTRRAQGAEPILSDPYVYDEYDENLGQWSVVFEVFYQDLDNDAGDVTLIYNNDQEFAMNTDLNVDPIDGRYYIVNMVPGTIFDDDTFYFHAEDTNAESTDLGSSDDPLLVGDYLGWGEKPNLSNPEVYFNEESQDYVFTVTYQDQDNDPGFLTLYVYSESDYFPYEMRSIGGNPLEGQEFEVSVPGTVVDEDWGFQFDAWDEGGSQTYFPDASQNALIIGDELGTGGNGGGNVDGDGSSQGFALPEWLNNAEVVVGIIGLVAIGSGSAYGVYRRKKKHGRFSDLLTEMDKIYGSFKTNPKRCELELEKMRSTINEDLKKSTIDDNNYSILKGRIDDILGEIRSESIRSEVAELPKDIELKIKDMLIDGEMTRAEYDKILPLIKGSDMAAGDKEKTKKMVESWMKKEKKE